MKRFNLEVAVGLFVLAGILALGYLSVKFGRLEVIGGDTYPVYARFEDSGGIQKGAVVEIAGVEVGQISDVKLDDRYRAIVKLAIRNDVKLQEDAIVSVKTKGLIGEKYIQISPGGSDRYVSPGGELFETESAIDIESLISEYIFGEI